VMWVTLNQAHFFFIFFSTETGFLFFAFLMLRMFCTQDLYQRDFCPQLQHLRDRLTIHTVANEPLCKLFRDGVTEFCFDLP